MMLYHFSEEPSIKLFEPRLYKTHSKPIVWAIEEKTAPLYFLPRDCPRIAFWPNEKTAKEDATYYEAMTKAKMVIAVESGWLNRIKECSLFVYHFSPETFHCVDDRVGYYGSYETVIPTKVERVGDLFVCFQDENIELRLTPSLYPLYDYLQTTTLHFSMIRIRNAQKRP
jgi:hypothetical protein